MLGLVRDFPALKIVFEHITTAEAVAFVEGAGPNVAATVTPHHLVINRNAIFDGGLRPHAYCLPVAKRERHRLAVRRAATSGSAKFFLGTDSAPHAVGKKEAACGCAGIFNAPFALETYAMVFEEEGALDRLRGLRVRERPEFLRPAAQRGSGGAGACAGRRAGDGACGRQPDRALPRRRNAALAARPVTVMLNSIQHP